VTICEIIWWVEQFYVFNTIVLKVNLQIMAKYELVDTCPMSKVGSLELDFGAMEEDCMVR